MLKMNISKVKIVTTMPTENAEKIRNKLGEMGAGIIGNYTHCTISTECIGTFKGTDKSNPYIGKKNILEKVDEVKIETQCEVEKVKKVVKILREIHPYEEPNIEIIPLLDENEF